MNDCSFVMAPLYKFAVDLLL